MNKITYSLVLLFFTIVFMSNVAGVNSTQIVSDNTNPPDIVNSPISSDSNIKGDCSTSVIQGEGNDSAICFRRDGTDKDTINVKHDNSSIKQYKIGDSYYFHILVNKDGWMVGNGGVETASACKILEDLSLKMFNENTISYNYLEKIHRIKSGSRLSHYMIKSPNGTYNLIICRNGKIFKDSGVLSPGDFLVVPNSIQNFQKGTLTNYNDTAEFMLRNCQLLAARDKYGIDRRQILTYYYKNNIVNSTVKVIVSNDDGRYRGVKSAYLVDNVRTNTRFISSSSIPLIDDYLEVDFVTFHIRKMGVNVTSQDKNVTGVNVRLTAKILDEFGNKVNKGFVSILINDKTIKDDEGNIVYVNVTNGRVSYKTTLHNIWKYKNFTYYMRYYHNNLYESSIGSNASIRVKKLFNLETNHVSNVYYGGRISIYSNVSYVKNKTGVNGGKIFYKINGKTIRNSLNNTLFKKVINGSVIYNYRFNSKYKARTYVLTTIYFNGVYRMEYNTTICISKIPSKLILKNINVEGKLLYFNATLVDTDNQRVKYNSIVSVKINGKTLKNSLNITRIFKIKNGKINFKFTLPYILSHKTNNITIVLPESKELLSLREVYPFEI